ncbi:hypothetical protein E2C01_036309 [Portunus trituberculatus]|uniref:Uncharacterized protein n=1 Tax=Portunus trituberculatus TaxID=210409 RepID=A0A5B7F8E2_PORTR|nr:hypothetical protein [Portunus trituberculatus]
MQSPRLRPYASPCPRLHSKTSRAHAPSGALVSQEMAPLAVVRSVSGNPDSCDIASTAGEVNVIVSFSVISSVSTFLAESTLFNHGAAAGGRPSAWTGALHELHTKIFGFAPKQFRNENKVPTTIPRRTRCNVFTRPPIHRPPACQPACSVTARTTLSVTAACRRRARDASYHPLHKYKSRENNCMTQALVYTSLRRQPHLISPHRPPLSLLPLPQATTVSAAAALRRAGPRFCLAAYCCKTNTT